ncbi:transcriptional regulator, LysR family [Moritella sp. PE36]|uniref:LysR family transcriptional regulator n=1 Tax=Moritella sp. PE36 TaxID=58051 RepID=UPI0001568B56|nr:LysR family transcriptional regulator [Moritella sp. PE36]EDM65685.1 transcriptional regulator, LysR family [Moritella sp. PE36]
MHINQIQTFIAITKSGSLAGASELLHVTPAALSQRIKQFEGRLGEKVFERTNRGMKLSLHGESIYGHALTISKEVENLFASVKNVDVNEENITLAFSNAFNPNDISRFSLSHSALSYGVDVRRMSDDIFMWAISKGLVDACVGFCALKGEDVSSLHLGTNRFVLIGENENPSKSGNYKVATPNIKELIALLPLSSTYKFSYTDCYSNALMYLKDKKYFAIVDEDIATKYIKENVNVSVIGDVLEIPFYLHFKDERHMLGLVSKLKQELSYHFSSVKIENDVIYKRDVK